VRILVSGAIKLRNQPHQPVGPLLSQQIRPSRGQDCFELLPNDRLTVRWTVGIRSSVSQEKQP
jgi:hypothetical protein